MVKNPKIFNIEKSLKMLLSQFSILGGRDSTRSVQSTLFQNPGGSPERDTAEVAGRNSTRALQSTLFQNLGGSPERGTAKVAGQYFPFLIQDTGAGDTLQCVAKSRLQFNSIHYEGMTCYKDLFLAPAVFIGLQPF